MRTNYLTENLAPHAHVGLDFLLSSLFSFIPMHFPTKVEWQIFPNPLPRHIKIEIFDVLTGDIENRILFIHICESTLGSKISFSNNFSIFRMLDRGRILGILAGLLLSAFVFVRLLFRFVSLGCGIFKRWKVVFSSHNSNSENLHMKDIIVAPF